MHAVKGKFGFDSSVDVFESVQDQTVERLVEAFEDIASLCKKLVEPGF
jgi:hypothetical protein